MAARLRLCRHHLHRTDAAGYCAAAWYSVAVQLGRGRAYPAGLAGVYGHLYAAVLADCHQLFLHACDPLSGRYAVRRTRGCNSPLFLGVQRPDAADWLHPVRHLSVVLRRNAPAGAVMFMAVCRDDPELERHELPDRYQGLPGHPVLLSGGDRAVFRAGISARLYSGCSCTGRHAVFHYDGVWPDDGVGCGAALPLFPAKR